MSQLTCEKLTLGYDSKVIIRNLSFSVNAGDYLCILGENGSGKTTLMKTILHLVKPLEGKITTGDGLQADEIGYLPQQTMIQKDFPASVREIVLSGCQSRCGKRPFYIKSERLLAAQAMAKMGITHLAKKCYRELSGGQQQRVSIARSLALKPKVLLFDEPTSALDPELTGEILAVIRQLASEKMTMIVVTHEMSFARDISDKIIFMADGVIVEEGEPKSLINNPQTDRLKDFLKRFNQ